MCASSNEFGANRRPVTSSRRCEGGELLARQKSRPVRLANEPATASGGSGALLYPPMDEEWDHFFASSFFMASLDIASSFFMAS
jgi:hypothetical protein